MKYDFSGYATRNDIRCTDGRVIKKNAFKANDGQEVPIVWMHRHDDISNVLGHAVLENRDDGVYAYGVFNDTPKGKDAKVAVANGDITKLSIWANNLTQNGRDVVHGDIKELSLVLAGANKGAYIDNVVIKHSEDDFEEIDEGMIYFDEDILCHSEGSDKNDAPKDSKEDPDKKKPEDEETLQDVFNTLTPKQKDCVYALVGGIIEDEDIKHSEEDENEDDFEDDFDDEDLDNEGDDDNMKRNAFEREDGSEKTLQHQYTPDEMRTIIADATMCGSLKKSFLSHAETNGTAGVDYGITDIDYLFPDAKTITPTPEFIKRDTGWVTGVMSKVRHTPFSRIKSVFANITADEARARGYVTGTKKVEEVFPLLKRATNPTTVYKKQKLDRDDITDITDFNVVVWLKAEMRIMLDEELARAILIGDGRNPGTDGKISEDCIRPISTDNALYTIHKTVDVKQADDEAKRAKAFIRTAIKARKDYKGSGQPVLYTTEDVLTDCLLLEDTTGRTLYDMASLKNKLRVSDIVTVPVMEKAVGTGKKPILGIIVNLHDYTVGADKGGAVSFFDDFDIDFNQQKYLIETRCSGALTVPYSAIEITLNVTDAVMASVSDIQA